MASKYTLIASNKRSYSFTDEVELEKYARLEEIDYISCVYSSENALIQDLERDGILSDHNHLAIRYVKEGKKVYIPLLYHVPVLREVISGIKEVATTRDGAPFKYRVVPRNNSFVNQQAQDFYEDISKNIDGLFYEVYELNASHRLEDAAYRYKESLNIYEESLEDIYDKKKIKENLDLEFYNYRNFRNYIYYTNRYYEKIGKERVHFIPNVSKIDDLPKGKSNVSLYSEKEEFLTEEDYRNDPYQEVDDNHGMRKSL